MKNRILSIFLVALLLSSILLNTINAYGGGVAIYEDSSTGITWEYFHPSSSQEFDVSHINKLQRIARDQYGQQHPPLVILQLLVLNPLFLSTLEIRLIYKKKI